MVINWKVNPERRKLRDVDKKIATEGLSIAIHTTLKQLQKLLLLNY